MVVEHHRPFLLGFQQLLLLTVLLCTLQVDLGIVRKERGDGDTGLGLALPLLLHSTDLFLQRHFSKWLLFIELLLHASKAPWRHLLLILQVGKLRLKEVEQLVQGHPPSKRPSRCDQAVPGLTAGPGAAYASSVRGGVIPGPYPGPGGQGQHLCCQPG